MIDNFTLDQKVTDKTNETHEIGGAGQYNGIEKRKNVIISTKFRRLVTALPLTSINICRIINLLKMKT